MVRKHSLAGRSKAQNLEWLRWTGKRPDVPDALWLVNWRALGSPRYCVYVIAPDGQWPVKVGISHCPSSRLASLQVGNWKRLEVAHCFWTHTEADARLIEQAVHRDYTEQQKWLLGEWVDTRPADARERVEWAALINGIDVSLDVPSDAIPFIQKRIDVMWPWAAYHAANGDMQGMANKFTLSPDY